MNYNCQCYKKRTSTVTAGGAAYLGATSKDTAAGSTLSSRSPRVIARGKLRHCSAIAAENLVGFLARAIWPPISMVFLDRSISHSDNL